jgi:hypothetical protein
LTHECIHSSQSCYCCYIFFWRRCTWLGHSW